MTTAEPIALAEAVAGVETLEWVGPRDARISGVVHDHREVTPGSLFCCIRGAHHDGHRFVGEAVTAGAVAILCEDPVAVPADIAEVRVASVRRAIGPVAAAAAGRPAERIDVIGVTGTNGKTTVTHLLAGVLGHAGRPTAVLGTLSGARTTPEAPELQRRLAGFERDGFTAVAMEVSSHALDQHRVDGTRFRVAVFTNLSRDHLDHHGTMAAYEAAKARLFRPELADQAVVNLDDRAGRRLAAAPQIPTVGFSLDQLDHVEVGPRGSQFVWRDHLVRFPLGGRYNVSNALAAAETARLLGVDEPVIAAGLAVAPGVPGRFELVDEGQDFTVLVDYAHTPDGLTEVLGAAAEGSGRVLVVFGCGGDRDATKRGPMGAAAARGADVVVLTSDNSRSEATDAILAAVRRGFDEVSEPRAGELVIEPDRRRAIAAALGRARPGDTVVVAGKGHETTQTIGDRVEPFDDRLVVAELLGERGIDDLGRRRGR